MPLNVVHPKLTGAPADPSALIDGPAWDASHVITGTLTAGDYGLAASALTDTTNADNITGGSQTGTGALLRATSIGGLASLNSPALTGTPTAPTPANGDNSIKIATTAFLATALASYETTSALATTLASYAPLASPAFTGAPTSTTPTNGDNSTKIATTAFVLANGGGVPATATPLSDALTGAVGTATKYAREDHVHPRVVTAPDVVIEEQQSSGTSAGACTTGSFSTRALNTLVRNLGTLATLSSGQVTLPAGTYYMVWSMPGYQCDNFKSKLQNVTDGALVAYGTTEFSRNSTAPSICRSVGSCVVTIGAAKAFAVQGQYTTAAATGLGVQSNFGTEVYSRLEITRIA